MAHIEGNRIIGGPGVLVIGDMRAPLRKAIEELAAELDLPLTVIHTVMTETYPK